MAAASSSSAGSAPASTALPEYDIRCHPTVAALGSARPFNGQRHRGWCFTVNNPAPGYEEYLRSIFGKTPKYVVCGREHAPSTGTPHLQGFIYGKNKTSDAMIHGVLAGNHYEPIKGTPLQNIKYCLKGEDYFEINPELKPVGQGARLDLKGLVAAAQSGSSTLSLIDAGGLTSGASLRSWRAIQASVRAPKRDDVSVAWFYGPSGVGKTRAANLILGDGAYLLSSAPWWAGYDGQQDVIVDDYDPTTLQPSTCLRILDRYPWFCPVKGGNIPFRGLRIIFTSCEHPSHLLGSRWPECLRRLSSVRDGRATMDGEFLYEFVTPPTGYPYKSTRPINAFEAPSGAVSSSSSSPASPHEAPVDVPTSSFPVRAQAPPLRF